MANETEEGVPPPATNPPDTTILDQRIRAVMSSMSFGGGGGDGGAGHLEARIAKLEAEVSNISDNIKDIKDTLREIAANMSSSLQRLTGAETEIKHLPGKGFVVTAAVGALALFGAIIVFQHQIQQLIGLAPIK